MESQPQTVLPISCVSIYFFLHKTEKKDLKLQLFYPVPSMQTIRRPSWKTSQAKTASTVNNHSSREHFRRICSRHLSNRISLTFAYYIKKLGFFFCCCAQIFWTKEILERVFTDLLTAPSVRRSEGQEPEAADHTASAMRSREMMQAAFPLMQSRIPVTEWLLLS